MPEAGTGTVKFEVYLEPFRIYVGRQPKFQYRRMVAANTATDESRAAGKQRIRRPGDTFKFAGHVIAEFSTNTVLQYSSQRASAVLATVRSRLSPLPPGLVPILLTSPRSRGLGAAISARGLCRTRPRLAEPD